MNKRNLKEHFEEIEKISKKISTVEDSLDFWEKKMDECFSKCDEAENIKWHPDIDQKISSLKKELELILGKIHLEEREMDRLDEKMDELYKSIFSSEA